MGTVSIADNAPGSPQTIALTGTGTVVKLSAATLDFGDVPVGMTSQPQTLTLTNVSLKNPLSIGNIAFSGPNAHSFAETNTCGTSVPAGASCAFSITSTPSVKGLKTATLNINDAGGASPQKVTLTGTGI